MRPCAILKSKAFACGHSMLSSFIDRFFFYRFVTKFSILPPTKNVDVNLTVAWWGNARGSAV
jgi:hypothetical protein